VAIRALCPLLLKTCVPQQRTTNRSKARTSTPGRNCGRASRARALNDLLSSEPDTACASYGEEVSYGFHSKRYG
jgi:hypothetical protein